MASRRWRWSATGISLIGISSAGWRWSGRSPGSRRGSTVAPRAGRGADRGRGAVDLQDVCLARVRKRTREALWYLMSRQLADLRLAVVMLDGIEIKGRMNVVALGITTEGEKRALGLVGRHTENSTVAGALLSDLVSRGLDVEQGVLFVIDGSKALRKAIRQVFGDEVPVERCIRHKERNVLEHLPERERPPIKLDCTRRGRRPTTPRARSPPPARGRARAGAPRRRRFPAGGHGGHADSHPAENHRQAQARPQSTNPCESMIGTVREIQRNVKNWSSGEMCRRWTAAGMLEAEGRVRKVQGLPRPRPARHPHRNRPHPTPQPAPHRVDHRPQCVTIHQGDRRPREIPRRAGQPPPTGLGACGCCRPG